MNKLLLPIGLGLAAFAMNMLGGGAAEGPAPVKLAVAAVDVKEGEVITGDMVEAVSAPGGSAVAKSAVPYAERGVVVIGQTARRKITKGDMLLYDDFRLDASELQETALGAGEAAVQVPLDHIKCPAGLLRLNAEIGFVVVNRPSPLGLEGALKAVAGQKPRILGPFRVVSVGGRTSALGKDEPAPQTIGVAVKPGADGKLDGVAAEFLQTLGQNAAQEGNEITAIVLFPSKKNG